MRRRQFLQAAGAATLAGTVVGDVRATAQPARPKIAALFTELRFRSHAFNILENFFEPYLFRGALVEPGVEVVSFYADQFPQDDMARDVARRLGVPLYPTIETALGCGGERLAVDGVLLIGEHGDYPTNDLGQKLYPRKEFFDRAVGVMQRSGRYVPLFNDKHWSYRADWAREMVGTARRRGFPVLAGSSVPLAERRPTFELPAEARVDEITCVHGGGFEVYDFHALECLQSIVEGRRGGETGLVRVEFLERDAALRAAEEGRWSSELFDAAIAAERDAGFERQSRPALGVRPEQLRDVDDRGTELRHVILLTYRDGTRGVAAAAGSHSSRWNVALRLHGESQPRALAYFNGPWGNRCLFKALSHAAQRLFISGREPYPAERTLLTSVALDAAVHSRAERRPIEIAGPAIAYQAGDWSRFREDGSSWRRITADVPQPATFDPGDAKLLR